MTSAKWKDYAELIGMAARGRFPTFAVVLILPSE